MLQGIIDLIVGIFDTIISIITFVIDFIGDLVMLIDLTANVAIDLPTYFEWLPSIAFSIFTVSITVVILYKVLGRT